MTKISKPFIIVSESIKRKMDRIILPSNISLSTITMTTSIDNKFHTNMIGKYLALDPDSVIEIKSGNSYKNNKTNNMSVSTNRFVKEKKNKRKKKQKKAFYNETTVRISTKTGHKANIKLFINGALQLTGCKSVDDALVCIDMLFTKLRKSRYIMDFENKKMVEIKFCESPDTLLVENIRPLKIAMINCHFNAGFKIDRVQLYDSVRKDILTKSLPRVIDCVFDPNRHACVSMKYIVEGWNKDCQTVIGTIFIFQKGCVIITGVRNSFQVLEAYKFIYKYLLMNYSKIVLEEN